MDLGITLLVIVVGLLLTLFAAAWILDFHGWLLVLIGVGLIGVMLLANHILDPKIERLLQGAHGERTVGAEIEVLSADGWHALHNISLGRGDVDHVLIGPGGIYTIETKSHRGRIRIDRIERRMLRQAYAEKQLLERITGYKVEPLLVFSQAWLVGDVPAKREGVTILPSRMLVGFIGRQRPIVSAERAAEVYGRLAGALTSTGV
jgi:hypothetical protein